MTYVFVGLMVLTIAWYLGTLSFIYHVFAFRFPNDITIKVLAVFLLLVAPISILMVSFLIAIYGVTF